MAKASTDPVILDFIRSQPAAVREAARRAGAVGRGGPNGTCGLLAFGCGTSYHAALLAAGGAGSGPAARVEPAYEVWTFAAGLATAGRVLAVSHSGETPATLRAVERARAGSTAEVVALTCAEGSSLARAADRVVAVPAADEAAGPKTKGYAASAAAMLAAVEADAGHAGAPARADAAGAVMEAVLGARPAGFDRLVALAREARHLWVLGAGPLVSVAREGALKIVEMAGVPARAMEQEEFIHGWRRGTGPDHLVVALAPAGGATARLGELRAMCAEQGARLAVVQPLEAPTLAGVDLTLPLPVDARPDPWAALPYVLPLQILAFALGTSGAPDWP